MRVAELVAILERRAQEAKEMHASAPVADVLLVVIRELEQVDADRHPARLLNSKQAGRVLGLTPKTVANQCAARRFAGARKTSSGNGGRWRIPATEVYEAAGHTPSPGPRLWEAS